MSDIAQKHPETWPCDCCERNRDNTTLFADGTRLCPECELPLVRQQLRGAVSALEEIANTVVLFGADVSLDWIVKRARGAADAVTDPKDTP